MLAHFGLLFVASVAIASPMDSKSPCRGSGSQSVEDIPIIDFIIQEQEQLYARYSAQARPKKAGGLAMNRTQMRFSNAHDDGAQRRHLNKRASGRIPLNVDGATPTRRTSIVRFQRA